LKKYALTTKYRVFNLVKCFLLFTLLCFSKGTLFAQQDTTMPVILNVKVVKENKVQLPKEYFSGYSRGYYNIKTDTVTQTQFEVTATLKNNIRQSVFIWLMTCSYDMNFTINNDYIDITPWPCDHNFPRLVEIKQGETKTYQFTLAKSIKFEYPCENCIYGEQVETTKLGLILVDDIFKPMRGSFMGYDIAMRDKSCWKILWSNPLYLLTKEEAHPAPVSFGVDKPKQ